MKVFQEQIYHRIHFLLIKMNIIFLKPRAILNDQLFQENLYYEEYLSFSIFK